jgi:uncharacterized protein
MDREIVAASFAWASGRRDGTPVAGADEDGFTLGVQAIEGLRLDPSDPPIERVQTVGAMPVLEPDDLAVALGVRGVSHAIRPGTIGELWAALASATGDPKPGTEAVVVVDLDPATGRQEGPGIVGALALGFARRPGLRFLGSAAIPAPVGEAGPSSSEAVLKIIGAREGVAPGPPRLLGARSVPGPSGPVAGPPVDDASGSLSPVESLRRAIWSNPDGMLSFESHTSDGIVVAVLEHVAPVPLRGGEPGKVGSLSARPPSAGTVRASLEPPNVSEGAYVPRSTYLQARASRWRLAAERCLRCDRVNFPARGRCAGCGNSADLAALELPRKGLTVEATTVVHRGAQPTEFDRQVEATGDYEVVIARAAPGVRVTLQVTDVLPGRIKVGDPIDAVLRRLIPMEGRWRYSLKAVPAPSDRLPVEAGGPG